jgi:hemerythrin-like domain-containing protein
MSKNQLFSANYEVAPDMLLDFLQQALAAMPTVTSFNVAESGDSVEFRTSFTWTSWGEKMVAHVEAGDHGGSVLIVSGEPKVELLSNPWGEEIHAATIEGQLFAALAPLVATAKTNPIMMLQADHRRVESLFARIATSEGNDRADLVQQLTKALRVHMELEERHVYPLLQSEVDAELAEEAEIEHQLARDGLVQLEELTPDEPGFDGALAMVVAGIEHHVLEEESEAFPNLVAKLGPDRLKQLAEQLTATRTELLEQTSEAASTNRNNEERPPRRKQQGPENRTPRHRRSRANVDPDHATKADLVQQAKKAGIGGYSHMTKAELAKALSSASAR